MKRLLVNTLLTLSMIVLAPKAMAIAIGFNQLANQVQVMVQDRGSEVVAGYDLDVIYAPDTLSTADVTFGNLLGPNVPTIDTLIPGILGIGEISSLSDLELDALQPNNFLLATILFDGDISNVSIRTNSISIRNVPEPGTILLLAAGGIIAFGFKDAARNSLRFSSRVS